MKKKKKKKEQRKVPTMRRRMERKLPTMRKERKLLKKMKERRASTPTPNSLQWK